MDSNHHNKDASLINNDFHKQLDSLDSLKFEDVGVDKEEDEEEEEDEESSSLLSSQRRGGISKDPKRSRRKVQWNDRTGNKLVEILEFQPSDASDTDDDDMDSCICAIM